MSLIHQSGPPYSEYISDIFSALKDKGIEIHDGLLEPVNHFQNLKRDLSQILRATNTGTIQFELEQNIAQKSLYENPPTFEDRDSMYNYIQETKSIEEKAYKKAEEISKKTQEIQDKLEFAKLTILNSINTPKTRQNAFYDEHAKRDSYENELTELNQIIDLRQKHVSDLQARIKQKKGQECKLKQETKKNDEETELLRSQSDLAIPTGLSASERSNRTEKEFAKLEQKLKLFNVLSPLKNLEISNSWLKFTYKMDETYEIFIDRIKWTEKRTIKIKPPNPALTSIMQERLNFSEVESTLDVAINIKEILSTQGLTSN